MCFRERPSMRFSDQFQCSALVSRMEALHVFSGSAPGRLQCSRSLTQREKVSPHLLAVDFGAMDWVSGFRIVVQSP